MTPDRFWRLVELLAGTADEETVPRLEAALAPGEHETFADAVQDHVDRLLARREVPGSHAGDTAEHLAAAVVAAGRDTYERELALDAPLDPGRWRWEEAERLLVAGLAAEEEPHDTVGDLAMGWTGAVVAAVLVGLAHPRNDEAPGQGPGACVSSWCPRGDLNPHALIRALAPQASASANSATRTSAGATVAAGPPDHRIGTTCSRCPRRTGARTAPWASHRQQGALRSSRAPAADSSPDPGWCT